VKHSIINEEDLLIKINELLAKYEYKLAQKDVSAKAYICWIKEDERYCTMPNEVDAVILTVDLIYKHQPDNIINLCLTMAYDDVENVADQTYKQMKYYIKKYSRYIIKKDYKYSLKRYNINVAKIRTLRKFFIRYFKAKNVIITVVVFGIIILIIDIIRRFVL